MKKIAFKKGYGLAMGLSFSLVAPYSHAAVATQTNNTNIEVIQISGQINSLLHESRIDFTSSSAPDIRKQLTQLPGISVNGNGMVSGIVQYRGLFSDRVKVTIDNIDIAGAGPNLMDSPLSHVIGTLSQEVTLYQGIAPVSAGAETIGGAIDITESTPQLSQSNEYELHGAINAGWFSNDAQSLSALVQASNNKAYFAFSGDVQSGDDYDAGNGKIVPNTFYNRNGAKLRAGFMQGKHSVVVTLSSRTTNDSGTPALAMDIIYIDALVGSAQYQYMVNNDWSIKAKVFANNNEHDMNNFGHRAALSNAAYRLNTVRSQGRGASLQANQLTPSWQGEYGIDLTQRTQYSTITNPNNTAFFLTNYNRVERNLVSAYAQLESDANVASKSVHWQLGARISQVNANAGEVDSNMAMMNPNVANLRNDFNSNNRKLDFTLLDFVAKSSLNVAKSLKLQVSAGVKEKAPSYFQLYSWFPLGVSAGLADGRNYLGNISLRPESAKKLDLAAVYSGSNYSFIPSIFYTQIDDYIIGLPSSNMSANMIATMNNIADPLVWENDEAVLMGTEFTYAHQLNNALSLRVSGQYVRGKQTGSIKQDLYRLAPLSGTINLAYSQSKYQVSTIINVAAAQNKVAQLQNETPTAGYAVFDAQFTYYFDAGLSLKILAENVFNKNYAKHLSGVSRVSSDILPAGNKVLASGRNIGAYVTYQF